MTFASRRSLTRSSRQWPRRDEGARRRGSERCQRMVATDSLRVVVPTVRKQPSERFNSREQSSRGRRASDAVLRHNGGFAGIRSIADVTLGGAAYRFYVQPVQLSLLAADGKQPEEWGLCGLVRVDRFRADSSAISSTYWLMLIAALAVLCLIIPLLKLHVLSPRERFHQSVWLYRTVESGTGPLRHGCSKKDNRGAEKGMWFPMAAGRQLKWRDFTHLSCRNGHC
jgi:hypothetical protein